MATARHFIVPLSTKNPADMVTHIHLGAADDSNRFRFCMTASAHDAGARAAFAQAAKDHDAVLYAEGMAAKGGFLFAAFFRALEKANAAHTAIKKNTVFVDTNVTSVMVEKRSGQLRLNKT